MIRITSFVFLYIVSFIVSFYISPPDLTEKNNLLALKHPFVSEENTLIASDSMNNLINAETYFTLQQLKQDFSQLRNIYENQHIKLYEYTSKDIFDSLFDHQLSLINRPMQYHEYFQILAPINDNIGCMHSSIWLPGMFWESGKEKLFPLQIKLIEGFAVVSGYYSDTVQVPLGSIVLEINSYPVEKIISDLKNSYSSDGFIEQFQYAQVEKRFPMAFARYYGFQERYIITYALPGRKTKERKELIPANLTEVRKIVFKNFDHPPPSLRILNDINTAMLRIPSFIFYDRVDYFKAFLDSAFLEIKNKHIENLILDLRGNDGGDPFCAVPLFSYLEKQLVPYFAEEYGRYSEFAKPIPLAENRFSGNLFTLIDKHCGSTNGHFCALLKYHKIGKIIGEEGGSTYKCNARTKEFILDNTKIMVYVPQGTFSAAVKDMDKTRGVEPDYYVTQIYKDYLNGKDTILEFVKKLILEKENKNEE
ncbi:MAG: S41 family peptidase [Ignavibacterium sp.]|nr:S41 family peptidase [Ignavibacterium sp.]